MVSIRKEFRLTDFEIKYIKEYADIHDCTETTAIKKIIQEHSQSHQNNATDFLVKEIADGVCENLSKLLTRVRLGVNNADRNSQILIELLNCMYANNPNYFFIERKQEVTLRAEDTVKKRIEHFRIKKLDSEVEKNSG